MFSQNQFFWFFILLTGLHHAKAGLPLEDVHCVKRCCSGLGSNLGTLLPSGYDPSDSLESKIVAVANSPSYYQKTSNLKSWVKSVIKLYVDAYSSYLKNVSVINVDDYFPGYESEYETCINNCQLDDGTDSFIRYLSEGLSSIKKVVSKSKSKSDKKHRKKQEEESSAAAERRANYNHEEAIQNIIRENQGREIYNDPDDYSIVAPAPGGYHYEFGWPYQ